MEFFMDIMTGAGLLAGIIVIAVMMFMGGDLHMFISEHAMIIIFGGSIAATMICGHLRIARTTSPVIRVKASRSGIAIRVNGAMISNTSPPEQKLPDRKSVV